MKVKIDTKAMKLVDLLQQKNKMLAHQIDNLERGIGICLTNHEDTTTHWRDEIKSNKKQIAKLRKYMKSLNN